MCLVNQYFRPDVVKGSQTGLSEQRVSQSKWLAAACPLRSVKLSKDLGPSMRAIYWTCALAVLASSLSPVAAQAPTETTIERSVRALPNKDTQVGIYLNVLPDCTSGPLPTIRLVRPPAAGKVVVKSGKAKATNYKACLALEVPAYVALYTSPPEFLGDDTFTLEIKYAGGRAEIQKFTVKVSGPAAQQKI